MDEANEVLFDPAGLNRAQRAGRACVVCGKRWPAPQVRVGRVAGGEGVYACVDDAPALHRTPAFSGTPAP
ncbi:hypothetical protein [Actinomadura flavalba]|uniref:hypothetical protein n=1 Tax=Actinomadura flavalba TaxID=1120938 RepID=UPI00036679D1|nr:hypothetical protein [Actinomadura flavalba]